MFLQSSTRKFKNLFEIPNLVDVKKTSIMILFPLPCPRRNANRQDLSFQTFEKILPSFTKVSLYYCTPRWYHWQIQQWKTWHLSFVQHKNKVHIIHKFNNFQKCICKLFKPYNDLWSLHKMFTSLCESLGLLHVNLLYKATIEKCNFNVHLLNFHVFNGH